MGDQIEDEIHKECVSWGRREVHAGFWWRDLKGKEHLED
jgi:hypothetical protein